MSLDPQARAMLDLMASAGRVPVHQLSPRDARAQVLAGLAQSEPEPVGRVEDRTIPGPETAIPVRIYWPHGDGPFPVLVFFHGSGFVICNLDTHDGICRSLTNGAGCVVVSVDYRLAPETKFPGPVEDCYAATAWVAKQAESLGADAGRLAVGGDSAGGDLAAAVAQMARDRGGPAIVFQLLIYPVTNYAFDTPSYAENGSGDYGLSTADMRWFWGHYLSNPSDGEHPYASPLRAQNLANLPPSLVITAECDVLRDEGEAYAAKLRAAGNLATCTRYEGMIHGFFGMGAALDKAKLAVQEASMALRSAFTG